MASKDPLLHGTYRPNLYFGTKTRSANPLLTGLLYTGSDSLSQFQHTRHECNQNDNLNHYAWSMHDARSFAHQNINDSLHKVDFKITLVQSQEAGQWAVKIKGSFESPSTVNVMFYFGLEGAGNIELHNSFNEGGYVEPVVFHGHSPDLGQFSIVVTDDPKKQSLDSVFPGSSLDSTNVHAMNMEPGSIWKIKGSLN